MTRRAEPAGRGDLGAVIERVRDLPSTPLPESTRLAVEAATSTDLGNVRVHRTPEAARYAEALGARAFTFDRDIVVGDDAGPTTIAHEATHAAQFARHGAPSAPLGVAGPGHPAHAEATAVAAGGAATGSSPGGFVQRDEAAAAARPRRFTPDEARKVGNALLEHLGLLGEVNANQLVDFLDANDALMSTLLGRYGYRGCYVDFPTTLNAFNKAYEKWFAAEGFHAQFDNPGHLLADPLYAKIREREQNQLVWGALPDGTGYMGTRRDLKAAVDDWHVRRSLRTGENIAGGLFGAIGYGLGGDEGSDLGSSVDGVVLAAGSTAEARNQMRDVGASLPGRQEQAEVRRAEVDPPAQRSPGPASPARPPVVEPAPPPRAPSVEPAPAPAPTPAPLPTRSEVDPIPVAPPAVKPKANRTPATPPPAPKATKTPAAPKTAKTPKTPPPAKTSVTPKTPGAAKPSKANAPGAPDLVLYPGWKPEWEKLAEQAMEPTPRASDNGFAFRTATSEDRKIRVVVTEGRITKAFIEDPERGPALPGEQSAHSVARNLGEETGPSTQASAPRASNLSQDKTAENFLRHAADVAAESGATIEVRTTLVTELRMVNGEEIPVQIAKRREAFLVMPNSIVSKEIYRYETQVDPVTRAVSEKTPPPRAVKGKVDKSQWIK